MGLLSKVVNVVVDVIDVGREPRPGDKLTRGHKVTIALAIVVGLAAIAALYLSGWTRLNS